MSHRRKKTIRVCFIFLEDDRIKAEDDISDEDMKLAFQVSEEAGLSPQWLTVAECTKAVGGKNNVFVLDRFEGDVFGILCKHKSRIVGPKCVRTCIVEGLPIPEARSPIYNMAMSNLVIISSHLSEEKKAEIEKLVGYMGGHYVKKLLKSVTHVVTNIAATDTCQKAYEQRIPVMVEEWTTTVWEASLVRNVKATDSEFDIYKCPVFYNMHITCSKFIRKEKEHIKELITKHGGICTPNLHQQQTIIVVVKEPYGEKYRFARAWDLPCVHPSWIFESVKKGYAVAISNHLVTPNLIPELKSPKIIREKSQSVSSDGDEASASVNSLDSGDKTDISETYIGIVSVIQQTNIRSPGNHENNDDSTSIHDTAESTENKNSESDCSNNFIHETLNNPGLFEGLIFFLAELNQETEKRMFSLITSSGGTTVTRCYDGIVNYAVVSLEGTTKETRIAVKALEVVTELWVEDCLEAAKVQPVHYYHLPMTAGTEQTKPLKGCCISFSSYIGNEKVFISKLAEHLGATCQKAIVRQTNEAKVEIMSTHLVCSIPTGSKYSAAVKYGVHIVTEEWLLACAKYSSRLDEQLYFPELYEDSQLSSLKLSSSQFLSPVAIPLSPVLATIESSEVETDCSTIAIPQIVVKSPTTLATKTSAYQDFIAFRNSLASSLSPPCPQSPFHVSTPESPYGQVFQTPTDSSKKRWKKWINSFPNFHNKSFSGPPQERKNSTPYSELRKRVFERFLDIKCDDDIVDPGTENIIMADIFTQ